MDKVEKIKLILLILIVLIIRLPPFYFFLKTPILSTHTIAKMIILILFLLSFFGKQKVISKIKYIYLIIGVYFFSQTISIIKAKNLLAFFTSYKDVLFAIMFFISTFKIVNNKNIEWITKTIFIATTISLTFQLCIYFFPNTIYTNIKDILYDKYLQFFDYQRERGRFFGDSFEEVTIPIFFYCIFHDRSYIKKILASLLIGIVIFITIASGWKTKAIILFSSLSFSLLFFIKKLKKFFLLLILIILLIVYFSEIISQNTIGKNLYDRFFNDKELTVVESSEGRISFWKNAIEVGSSSPFTGVGLGNYFDNLSQKEKIKNTNSQPEKIIVIDDPHNIFFSSYANTGLLGLISTILLFAIFLFYDSKIFLKKSLIKKLYIISFWSLFIFCLFNPYLYFSYFSYLFFLRGVSSALN